METGAATFLNVDTDAALAQPRTGFRTRTAPLLARGRSALVFGSAAAVLAVWLLWLARDGGYYPRDWYPAGVLFAAGAAVLALGGHPGPRGRPARIALLALVGWAVLGVASVLWAASPGSAWEAGNELLVLAGSAAVLAATPFTPATAAVFMGVWSVGAAGVMGADLVAATRATDLREVLQEFRYVGPTGYPNASAALGAMAFWTSLLLSARPRTPVALRPVLLTAAVFSLLYGLLPQSRASMLALLLVAPVVVALSANRIRLLARLGVAGAAVALSAEAVFGVYSAGAEERPVAPALDAAGRAILLGTLLALAASVVLALLEDRARVPAHLERLGRRVALAAVCLALLVGAVVGVANAGRAADAIETRWAAFKGDSAEEIQKSTGPRFGTLFRDQRYDFWRVSLDAFGSRPVAGIGAGNFERLYTAERRDEKHSRYVHNVWLRVLAEGGLVGALLFAGAFLALLGGLIAAAWRGPAEARAVSVVGVALLGHFGLHAGFDWLDEFPALIGPVFGFGLVALGCAPREPRIPRPHGRFRGALAGLAVLVALASLVPPWLSARYSERALERARTDARAAYPDTERAAALNPLSPQPHLDAGRIALGWRDYPRARRAYADALAVEEHWVARFQLALLDAEAGRFASAERQVRAAARLNGVDPLVPEAARAIAAGRRLDPVEFPAKAFEQPVFEQAG